MRRYPVLSSNFVTHRFSFPNCLQSSPGQLARPSAPGPRAQLGYMELFVPGRVCVLGEHSDWAGGFRGTAPAISPGMCVVVGTSEGLHARVVALNEPILRLSSDGHELVTLRLDPGELHQLAAKAGFWSYAAGTAAEVLTRYPLIRGGLAIDNYLTTLPLKRGLSSSAAICVLTARAFSTVFGLGLSVEAEMDIAYAGERRTPSLCGRLDQAVAYGPGNATRFIFDGAAVVGEPLIIGSPFHLLAVDLKGSKDTAAILRALQGAYPHPVMPAHDALHRFLGETNIARVTAAVAALAAGDASTLGHLMAAAQSDFDACAGPLCPTQLTAPMLHAVLTDPEIALHVHGGKWCGAGGDGSAILVCKDEIARFAARAIIESRGYSAFDVTLA